MHPLFLHPKPFTATGHLTATLPKSPQIQANQAGHLVVSKYIMHFHPILCAWKEPEAGRLVIKNKDYSPASLAVITKRMSLLLSPFLQPKSDSAGYTLIFIMRELKSAACEIKSLTSAAEICLLTSVESKEALITQDFLKTVEAVFVHQLPHNRASATLVLHAGLHQIYRIYCSGSHSYK